MPHKSVTKQIDIKCKYTHINLGQQHNDKCQFAGWNTNCERVRQSATEKKTNKNNTKINTKV